MEIVFYFACPSAVSQEKVLPEIMVNSAREHMDCKIIQCTDLYTEEVSGVDKCIRFPSRPGFAESKVHAFAGYETGEALYVDCDVVFLGDVSDIWEQEFEYAVRPANPKLRILDAPHVFDSDELVAPRMPYNTGILFSRDQSFWIRDRESLPKVSGEIWYEEQIVECDILKQHDLLLLEEAYHYVPQYFLEDLTGQKLVHFKGRDRKLWMAKRYGHSKRSMGALKKVKYGNNDARASTDSGIGLHREAV